MKRGKLSLLISLATALVMLGCQKTPEPVVDTVKKLTYGTAKYVGPVEESETQRYVVELFTNKNSATAGDDFSEVDVSLSMELITTKPSTENEIVSGEYTFSSGAASINTIADSENSTLYIATPENYGGQSYRLDSGRVTITSFKDTYNIEGEVRDVLNNTLEFSFYGKLSFSTVEPEPTDYEIDFEDAELAAESGSYSNILWGLEKAAEIEGGVEFDGILYTSDIASFGSYYSRTEYEMWGGFAISSNNNLEDLGMDYSNQFSVYAPQTDKFAIGYIFGDYGGDYANPVIELASPAKIVSADIANANKTYHYCNGKTIEDEEGNSEAIWAKLTITGYNGQTETGSVTVDLADENGVVIADWTTVDLSSLGLTDKVTFAMDSNDRGEWGVNVPMFFCIDNIVLQK